MPCSIDLRAAVSAAICAAHGVDFLLPLEPMLPELARAIDPPCVSVIVTIVLLNDERICATPCETFLTSRFLRGRAFFGAAGIYFPFSSNFACDVVAGVNSLFAARTFGFLLPGDGLFRTLARTCV